MVSKYGLYAFISSQISFRFTEELLIVPFYAINCILVSELSIVQLLGQSEVSDNRGFWPFERQVANTLAALFFNFTIKTT